MRHTHGEGRCWPVARSVSLVCLVRVCECDAGAAPRTNRRQLRLPTVGAPRASQAPFYAHRGRALLPLARRLIPGPAAFRSRVPRRCSLSLSMLSSCRSSAETAWTAARARPTTFTVSTHALWRPLPREAREARAQRNRPGRVVLTTVLCSRCRRPRQERALRRQVGHVRRDGERGRGRVVLPHASSGLVAVRVRRARRAQAVGRVAARPRVRWRGVRPSARTACVRRRTRRRARGDASTALTQLPTTSRTPCSSPAQNPDLHTGELYDP